MITKGLTGNDVFTEGLETRGSDLQVLHGLFVAITGGRILLGSQEGLESRRVPQHTSAFPIQRAVCLDFLMSVCAVDTLVRQLQSTVGLFITTRKAPFEKDQQGRVVLVTILQTKLIGGQLVGMTLWNDVGQTVA